MRWDSPNLHEAGRTRTARGKAHLGAQGPCHLRGSRSCVSEMWALDHDGARRFRFLSTLESVFPLDMRPLPGLCYYECNFGWHCGFAISLLSGLGVVHCPYINKTDHTTLVAQPCVMCLLFAFSYLSW